MYLMQYSIILVCIISYVNFYVLNFTFFFILRLFEIFPSEMQSPHFTVYKNTLPSTQRSVRVGC